MSMLVSEYIRQLRESGVPEDRLADMLVDIDTAIGGGGVQESAALGMSLADYWTMLCGALEAEDKWIADRRVMIGLDHVR